MIKIHFRNTSFISNLLLPSCVFCIFVLFDKMDVVACSDPQWFCKGLIALGVILLNLLHWIFFYSDFSSSQDVFQNCRQTPEAAFLYRVYWGSFPFLCGGRVCGKNKVHYFSSSLHVLLVLSRQDDLLCLCPIQSIVLTVNTTDSKTTP